MRTAGRALTFLPAALLAAHAAPALARYPFGRSVFEVVSHVGAHEGCVALTFDDGPDEHLEHFLKALGEAGARATFFAVGEQVEKDPGRLREIVTRGHEVAVHCYRHRNHLRLTPAQTVEDMRRARATVEDASGRRTRFFRPPYGVFNLASWIEAYRQGWERVLWSRWGKDWEALATPRSIAGEIGRPQTGDVLLLHDSDRYSAPGSWKKTLGALPIVLEGLEASGLRARTLGELVSDGAC